MKLGPAILWKANTLWWGSPSGAENAGGLWEAGLRTKRCSGEYWKNKSSLKLKYKHREYEQK